MFARMTICHFTPNGLFTCARFNGDFCNNTKAREGWTRKRGCANKGFKLRIRDGDLKTREKREEKKEKSIAR